MKLKVLLIYLLLNLISFSAFGAVNFDGGDDYINCGSDTSIDDIFDAGGTIAFWMKPDSGGEGDWGRCLEKRVSDLGWYLPVNETDDLIVLYHEFTGVDGYWATDDNSLVWGNWYHIAVTYNNSNVNNDPIIYINGQSVNVNEVQTPEGTRKTDAAQTLYIASNSGTTRCFDGIINEVAIWKTILSASEISLLYNARLKGIPLQIQPANLKLYLPLDDHPHNDTADSANTLVFKDLSGNGNDGTASGCNSQGEIILSYPPQVQGWQ